MSKSSKPLEKMLYPTRPAAPSMEQELYRRVEVMAGKMCDAIDDLDSFNLDRPAEQLASELAWFLVFLQEDTGLTDEQIKAAISRYNAEMREK